jgi:UDP-glucose 4-epimerase
MRVFVTGGAGFVGSNLIEFLINKGVKVGYCDNSFSSNEFSKIENANLVCGDISEVTESLLSEYDALVHLAAVKKHNALTDKDESALYTTNFINTARLFEVAGNANIKNIIFSSSLYANGNLYKLNVDEGDMPCPLTLYGQSKLFGELALREAAEKFGFNATAFRLYFIYGPKQYSGKGYPSVFLRSFERLKNGAPPVIVNDGLQRLDYLYVDDLCKLIYKSLFSPMPNFNLINACSSRAYSINHIVDKICDEWNSRFGSSYSPIYDGKDFTLKTYRSGSNKIANSSWGWVPNITLENGISNMLDWYLNGIKSD